MIEQKKSVIQTSLMAVGFVIQEMVNEGWEIDPELPLAPIGFNYECGFIRTISEEQEAEELVESNKPTRAEILAKARLAKKMKDEARAANNG